MAPPVPKSCHLNCISAGPSPTATGCQASPGCNETMTLLPSIKATKSYHLFVLFFRTEVHGRFPGFVINLRKRPDKVTASSSDLKRRLYQYNQMKRRQGKKALHNTLQSPFNQYSFECAFSRSATAMNYSSCSQKKNNNSRSMPVAVRMATGN